MIQKMCVQMLQSIQYACITGMLTQPKTNKHSFTISDPYANMNLLYRRYS